MSYQMLNEPDQNSSDIDIDPGNELHTKALNHTHDASGSRISLVQQSVPKRLPWNGLAETDSSKKKPDNTSTNMDTMPLQYELHSNTKTHQLGGVYESYSALG